MKNNDTAGAQPQAVAASPRMERVIFEILSGLPREPDTSDLDDAAKAIAAQLARQQAAPAPAGFTLDQIAAAWVDCGFGDIKWAMLENAIKRLAAPTQAAPAEASDLQQIKALALAYKHESFVKVSPAVVLDLIARIERADSSGIATPAASAPTVPEGQTLIGKLLDDFSNIEHLWGLNEPGALVRHRDVFNLIVAAGKAFAAAPTASADAVVEAERYRFLRDHPWSAEDAEFAQIIQLQQNSLWDEAIDTRIAFLKSGVLRTGEGECA